MIFRGMLDAKFEASGCAVQRKVFEIAKIMEKVKKNAMAVKKCNARVYNNIY